MNGVAVADAGATVVTGALLAREAERAQAPGHDPSPNCANCGAHLAGPFCHACGQHGHVHRTVGALLHDLSHGVFHFEGKLWATLPLLAWRPGELTRRYVHGERARFVSPVALFLFCVFLMFAILSNLPATGAQQGARDGLVFDNAALVDTARVKVEETLTRADRDIAANRVTRNKLAADPGQAAALKKADARLAERQTERATLAALLARFPPTVQAKSNQDTAGGWLDEKLQKARNNPDMLAYKVKASAYKWSWVLIPLSLPFIWLLFPLRRDVGFYDHAIFTTYSLSFMSLLAIILTTLNSVGVPKQLVAFAWLIIPPWHLYRQLKGAYRLGRLSALWRTAWTIVFASITMLVFVLLLLYLSAV